jgi:hypothetical protein
MRSAAIATARGATLSASRATIAQIAGADAPFADPGAAG